MGLTDPDLRVTTPPRMASLQAHLAHRFFSRLVSVLAVLLIVVPPYLAAGAVSAFESFDTPPSQDVAVDADADVDELTPVEPIARRRLLVVRAARRPLAPSEPPLDPLPRGLLRPPRA